MLCANLRNKQYCFENEQMTQEAYKQKIAEWDLRSRKTYSEAVDHFDRMLRERAWHRATLFEQCEECTGNYLIQSRNAHNCYMGEKYHDCINLFRGHDVKDTLDSVCMFRVERAYDCVLVQDQCYDMRHCYNVMQSKSMEYCAHCLQCEHCFGCCGLVGKKYHLFNRACSQEEYERRKADIIAAMERTGEYGRFFPSLFSAVIYEESLAQTHWPLTRERAAALGFRIRESDPQRVAGSLDSSEIPDRAEQVNATLLKAVFWDEEANRPFQIQQADTDSSMRMNVPLLDGFYARRLRENFRRMPCAGDMRGVACGRCKAPTATSWPAEYDGRILCENCYLKEVY
jgi:hypothetical protein